jgi:hypothetical protein
MTSRRASRTETMALLCGGQELALQGGTASPSPSGLLRFRRHGFVRCHIGCWAEPGARGELAVLARAARGWHEPGTERADSLGWLQ